MKRTILVLSLCFSITLSIAQNVAINNDGAAPDASAALDIKSTDKGMLVPRMTTGQRTIIASPATGLLVFDTTTGSFWFYNGTVWTELAGGGGGQWSNNGNNIYNNNTGNVGIGTNAPANSALLHLNSTTKAFLPPSMTTDEMTAINSPQRGMMVYNNFTRQPYIYTQYRKTINPVLLPQNRWEPIMTGPRMLAWGFVDSCSDIITGSGNFSVTWDGYTLSCDPTTNDPSTNWYKLRMTGIEFDQDSMLLMVTAVGNGSWDQAVAIGLIIEGPNRFASIKFTDISRIAASFPSVQARRRSKFYFTLFDMRKDPFQ